MEDILSTENKLKKWDTVLSKADYFLLMGIYCAIPSDWKRLLNVENESTDGTDSQPSVAIDSTSLNSKSVYKELIKKVKIPPTAQSKFNSLDCDLVALDWKEIYILPRRVTIDSYSRCFQYKILNRILYTNSMLFKMNLVPSPKCSFCQEHDESLEHLLVHCKFSQSFWSTVASWLISLTYIDIRHINERMILLGIFSNIEYNKLINHIIIIGKQVIYSCRCKNLKPNLKLLQIKLREIYKIELIIAKKPRKETIHYEKWQPLLAFLVN